MRLIRTQGGGGQTPPSRAPAPDVCSDWSGCRTLFSHSAEISDGDSDMIGVPTMSDRDRIGRHRASDGHRRIGVIPTPVSMSDLVLDPDARCSLMGSRCVPDRPVPMYDPDIGASPIPDPDPVADHRARDSPRHSTIRFIGLSAVLRAISAALPGISGGGLLYDSTSTACRWASHDLSLGRHRVAVGTMGRWLIGHSYLGLRLVPLASQA